MHNTLQAGDTTTYRCREGLDISGRSTDKGTKLALDHLDEFWVLCEDRCCCSAIDSNVITMK